MNRLKKIAFTGLLIPYLFFSNVQAQPKDNFPLELKKYEYVVRLASEVGNGREDNIGKLEEGIYGNVGIEIKKEDETYVLALDIKSGNQPINLFGDFESHHNIKFVPSGNSQFSYKSLEHLARYNFRVGLGPFKIPVVDDEKHFYFTNNSNRTELKITKTNFNESCEMNFTVPSDTQDPLTLLINLLSRGFSESEKGCYIGKIKGDNEKGPVDIYADIKREGDKYFAKFTFPKKSFLDNRTPIKIYYEKNSEKVKVLRIDVFLKKFFNKWAVATPKTD